MSQQENEVTVFDAVSFAGKIVECAEQEQLDFTTIFNGLAIATGTYLTDYAVDLDGNVDKEELQEVLTKFSDLVGKAAEFATAQVTAMVEANKQQ